MYLIFATIADLISTAIFMQFPLQLLNLKKDKPIYKVLLVISYISVMIVSFLSRINEQFNVNPFKSLFSLIVLLGSVYFICFSNKIIQKVIAFILFLVSICLSELLLALFLSFLGISLRENKNLNVVGCYIGIVVLWFFLILSKKIFDRTLKNKNYSSKFWQFYIIVLPQTMVTVAIVFSLYIHNDFSLTQSNVIFYIFLGITFISMIVCDIVLYRVLLTNSENYELKEALELSNLKNELELDYYNKMKTSIAETRKLNHDISNVITVVKAIVDKSDGKNKEQADAIIKELSHTLENNKIKTFCNNELVNIILQKKYDVMKENKIEFSCNLDISDDINIKNFDLCRLFTNIIDNAIDACLNSKNKNKLFIVLSSKTEKNSITIDCANYCDNYTQKGLKKLISTKPNHIGFGIEIINSIAQSYYGNFTYNFKDNTFYAIVLLRT